MGNSQHIYHRRGFAIVILLCSFFTSHAQIMVGEAGIVWTCANPAAITGTLTCATSATSQLTDVTTGGVWASSTTTVATINSTGLVSGVAAGTSTISYTVAGGCRSTATFTVTSGGPTYATLDPANTGASLTLSGGNLTAVMTGGLSRSSRATLGKSTGKWYWEVKVTSYGTYAPIGIEKSTATLTDYCGKDCNGWSWLYQYTWNCGTFVNASYSAGPVAAGDVIGVALDMTNGKLFFRKNGGTWIGDPVAGTGAATTGLSGTWFPCVSSFDNVNYTVNFGATSFSYSVPTGYSSGVF